MDVTVETPVHTEERNFRPLTLKEFVGQSAIKESLGLMLESAQKRGTTLEHVCFHGGPGLGKTTLAQVIANEMGGCLRELSAPALMKPGDLVSVLILLGHNDVLFLDETHALKREISEVLYSAMEDFRVGIPFKEGERPLMMTLKRFTLVGATTDYGLLPEPLRARFGQIFPLDLYTQEELEQVVARAAEKLGVLTDRETLFTIARRSRGTPRVALRLFRRCYDLAAVRDSDLFFDITRQALDMMRIDELGLDDTDRRYLKTLAEVYGGGPAGPKPLAASAGMDQATLEQAVEPWLVRSGLVARTRRGRKLTRKGLAHITPHLTGKPAVTVLEAAEPGHDEEDDFD